MVGRVFRGFGDRGQLGADDADPPPQLGDFTRVVLGGERHRKHDEAGQGERQTVDTAGHAAVLDGGDAGKLTAGRGAE